MILGLQLSRHNKVVLSGIFLLGGFVVITGILRLTFSYTPGAFYVNYDQVDLWSILHVCTGIICACLPTYRPLLTKVTALPSTLRKKYNLWSTSQKLGDSTQEDSRQLPSMKLSNGYYYSTADSHGDEVPLTSIEAANKSHKYLMKNGYDARGIMVSSTVDIV
ncbi:hypothetical protein MMC15_004786 [Xylographa vitiligo]|nr:hypothetical protein [Xylographa vitiligo]